MPVQAAPSFSHVTTSPPYVPEIRKISTQPHKPCWRIGGRLAAACSSMPFRVIDTQQPAISEAGQGRAGPPPRFANQSRHLLEAVRAKEHAAPVRQLRLPQHNHGRHPKGALTKRLGSLRLVGARPSTGRGSALLSYFGQIYWIYSIMTFPPSTLWQHVGDDVSQNQVNMGNSGQRRV